MQVISIFQDQFHPQKVLIEMSTRFQIPSFQILGLPAPEIQEARERIMAAFMSSGFDFPKKKVVVNLAPSALPKSGTGHDLAIAVTILQEVLDIPWPEHLLAWGELGLNGRVKPCGHIGALIEILITENLPLTLLLCPEDAIQFYTYVSWRIENQLPALPEFKLLCIRALEEIPDQIQNPKKINLESLSSTELSHTHIFPTPLALLPLSSPLRRLLHITMVGRHHALLLGPKGVGKSQMLEWFKALTPNSKPSQTWMRLLHSESKTTHFTFDPPIRRVHAQVKPAHLFGSFNTKGFKAGELALAHGGLLIADEFLEWHRDAKECLREPLEKKEVYFTKLQGSIHYPCDIHFVGTGNLCRCGGMPEEFISYIQPDVLLTLRDKLPPCKCRHQEVRDYFGKVSGPIADRIDLVVVIAPSKPSSAEEKSENNDTVFDQLESIKKGVARDRAFALQHFSYLPGEIPASVLEERYSRKKSFELLLEPIQSLRSRHKILRIAHTLQAMDQSVIMKEVHLFEAIQLRWKEPT